MRALDDSRTGRQGAQDEPAVIQTEISVTPFSGPVSAPVEIDMTIPEKWRDPQIEELVEFELWEKARDLATERLEDARTKGHVNLVKVYETYIVLLGSRAPI